MDDITLKDILEHMRGMENRLDAKIDALDIKFTEKFDFLDKKIDHVEEKLTQKIENAEIKLSTQISNIDERLDTVEIEQLPKRVTKLEKHTGLVVA